MSRKTKQRAAGPDLSTIASAVARTIDTTVGTQAACVLSTRVLLKTAERAGFHGKAEPVHVEVHNAAAVEFIAGGQVGTPSKDAFSVIVGSNKNRMIGADRSNAVGNWEGHLVARFGRTLVDANFHAFHRPEHGILLPLGSALVMNYNATEWQKFQSGLPSSRELPNGCYILVVPLEKNASYYLNVPDWLDQRSDGVRVNTLVDMAWADASATIAA